MTAKTLPHSPFPSKTMTCSTSRGINRPNAPRADTRHQASQQAQRLPSAPRSPLDTSVLGDARRDQQDLPLTRRARQHPGEQRLDRRHGGRRARVRGMTKVAADFSLLAAAVNLARLGVLGLRRTAGPEWQIVPA